MIERIIKQLAKQRMSPQKAIIIIGPHRVGKTALLHMLSNETIKNTLFMNCDEPGIRQKLNYTTATELKAETSGFNLILIDEAQRVQNIEMTLKLLVDIFPGKQVVVTSSTALGLSDSPNGTLTGRKYEYTMLPISAEELIAHHGKDIERRLLERRLVYGSYPEVVNHAGDECEALTNLSGSNLYKDIFAFQDVRKPEIIEQLLQALALRIGSEVSYNELGCLIGLNSQTVRRYIDFLEKSFIVFHLSSFNRDVQGELKKSHKIYFWDNGIRNAILGDFKPINLRQDIGALWENYLVVERLKHHSYSQFNGKCYFWRTKQQQEIDYLEDIDGELRTYEFRWDSTKHPKLTATFSKNYPNHTYAVINPDNYQEFVTGRI